MYLCNSPTILIPPNSIEISSLAMRALYKIPLLLLFIGACMGLFLRYQLIAPTQAINFSYVLHGHSHVMFLGWVFNVLYLAFVTEFTAGQRIFRVLFWILQVCVVGMLIAFPMQGYGLYSIAFTTVHTLTAFVFIGCFLYQTRASTSIAITLARSALFFFVLSSFGPFYLGYLKASGQEHSNLYRFSIYFYLHFQYNGFFFFGVLTLLIKAIEHKLSRIDRRLARQGSRLLLVACIPTYLLSILWAHPNLGFHILGFFGALLQAIALLFFITPFKLFRAEIKNRSARLLVVLSATALLLKCTLQIISSYPDFALLANEYRVIVIAYLHLVLLGFISFFLISWLIVKNLLPAGIHNPVLAMIIGFIGSEVLLVIMPWSTLIFSADPILLHKDIFLFSILLTAGTAWITYAGTTKSV